MGGILAIKWRVKAGVCSLTLVIELPEHNLSKKYHNRRKVVRADFDHHPSGAQCRAFKRAVDHDIESRVGPSMISTRGDIGLELSHISLGKLLSFSDEKQPADDISCFCDDRKLNKADGK